MAQAQKGSFFTITANGTFQAVTLTSDCDVVDITCRATNTAVYTNIDDPQEFHVSFSSDGAAFRPTVGFEQTHRFQAGDIVCYVRAATSNIIVVNGVITGV